MSGHKHEMTSDLPDIWTLIPCEWDGRCSLCKKAWDAGDLIYHNPQKVRGFRARCQECHEGMPGWQEITAKPEPAQARVPERDLSNLLAITLVAFDDGLPFPEAEAAQYPQYEQTMRIVWRDLENDLLERVRAERRNAKNVK